MFLDKEIDEMGQDFIVKNRSKIQYSLLGVCMKGEIQNS